MRLSQLIENVNDDIKILSMVADLVLSWLPNVIPENDTIHFGRLPASHSLVTNTLSKVPKDYHGLVIQLLTKTNYVFNNTKEHLKTSDVGVHVTDNVTGMAAIVINISVFVGSYDSISKEELLTTRSNNKPFKTIKAIMIHEMRHAQQFENYGGHPKSDTYSYSQNPDEIDAAWLHHLEDYDVNNYDTALEYVRSVMTSFEVYKSLTNKQKRQYLKKTASYWYQHHNPTKKTVSVADKVGINKENNIKKLLDEIHSTTNITGINDLRTYDGYPQDEENFILPYENFIIATTNALTSDTSYNEKMIAYVYGFLSMLHNRFGFDISIAKSILSKKYSMTITEAIELIRRDGFGKFNDNYFISVMSKVI